MVMGPSQFFAKDSAILELERGCPHPHRRSSGYTSRMRASALQHDRNAAGRGSGVRVSDAFTWALMDSGIVLETKGKAKLRWKAEKFANTTQTSAPAKLRHLGHGRRPFRIVDGDQLLYCSAVSIV